MQSQLVAGVPIEIVGIHKSDFGRSCALHQTCGSSLQVGDVIRLSEVVIDVVTGFTHLIILSVDVMH